MRKGNHSDQKSKLVDAQTLTIDKKPKLDF
jgi:hypothetical protein